MSYDVKSVAAIMKMATEHARSELLYSGVDKRDYAFLEAVYAASGMEYINEIRKTTGLGLLGGRMDPIETAVVEGDADLMNWFLDRQFKYNGNYTTQPDVLPYPKVTFPAMEDAFALGRREFVDRFIEHICGDGGFNFQFSHRTCGGAGKEFLNTAQLDMPRPEGLTPLGCALANDWDDLVERLLPGTRQTFEYDLMVAIKRGSAHAEAIASKLKGIKFNSHGRKNFNVMKSMDEGQRTLFFDLLKRFAPPMEFGDGKNPPPQFGQVIAGGATLEEARFYLEYPGLVEHFKSRKVDPLHNLLGAAVSISKMELVQWLVEEMGVDPNGPKFQSPDLISGYPAPVFLAKGPMLEYLVKMGADTNVIDEIRATPLIAAVKSDDRERVEKLIMLGADAALKADGRSALQWAKDENMRKLIRSARMVATVSDAVPDDGAAAQIAVKKSPLSPL